MVLLVVLLVVLPVVALVVALVVLEKGGSVDEPVDERKVSPEVVVMAKWRSLSLWTGPPQPLSPIQMPESFLHTAE